MTNKRSEEDHRTMILTFTGPSELTRSQELAVVKRLEELDHVERVAVGPIWRSGCAFGVDTIVARQATLSDVDGIELYVPAAPHNEELVMELAGIVTIVRCPTGAEPYRIRNQMMINGLLKTKADRLVAFLKSDKFYRSGEWMTVNIAKRVNVPVEVNLI